MAISPWSKTGQYVCAYVCGIGLKRSVGFPFDYNGWRRRVSTNQAIRIVINGESRSVPQGHSILQLLETLDLDPARVAVELDRRIVKPPDWPATSLAEGAQLEIVQFVGGG
jgi:sulfur carrier protein